VIAPSVATYRLYVFDKLQAVRGRWRLPETSLRLAELGGGWPGAFLAQRRVRHKRGEVLVARAANERPEHVNRLQSYGEVQAGMRQARE
jgi:hypothetical protein